MTSALSQAHILKQTNSRAVATGSFSENREYIAAQYYRETMLKKNRVNVNKNASVTGIYNYRNMFSCYVILKTATHREM